MSTSVIDRYIAAWNAHDADGIVACFADGGTYEDPATGGPLTSPAIGGYAGRLFGMYSDLRFEHGAVNVTGDGQAAFEWRMTGTNDGPLPGLPPSGKAVDVAGIDAVEIVDDRIRALRGYFDRQDNLEQLGLQVMVQPHSIGPFDFGAAVHVSGPSRAKPGAVTLTWVEAASPEAKERIRQHSRSVASGIATRPGFVGYLGSFVGLTGFTVTAWESLGAARAGVVSDEHKAAIHDFIDDTLATSTFTSTWAAC